MPSSSQRHVSSKPRTAEAANCRLIARDCSRCLAERCRYDLLAFNPDSLPSLELTGSELVAREVPFVQPQEFSLGHVPESFALRLGDMVFLHPGCDIGRSGLSVQPPAHHFSDD